MNYFDNINFEYTQDGSVGIYDANAGDILHSRTGALKEANEKFINPILKILSYFQQDINILDICYGIGYNTKTAIETLNGYNLNIDALECNLGYIFISPFINDLINNHDVKMFLISQILNTFSDNAEIGEVLDYISNKKFNNFLSDFTRSFFERFDVEGYINIPSSSQPAFLHNIYYQYISDRMKTYSIPNIYKHNSIRFFLGDARKSIFQTNNMYDIIFLDAFSPQKDPTLWTIDFLSVLKLKMKPNSVLLSYSKSAPFRSALLQLGFFVGKTLLNNSDMGTIASTNSLLVSNKLDKTDIDIIETRSGIPYRDINLSLPSSSIIINRSIEGAASTRISRTQFQKSL